MDRALAPRDHRCVCLGTVRAGTVAATDGVTYLHPWCWLARLTGGLDMSQLREQTPKQTEAIRRERSKWIGESA